MLTKTKIKWIIDSTQSAVDFEVKQSIISNVKGTFKLFNAAIYTTDNDFTTAKVDFWIAISSIETGNIYIDEHLKGRDFFDVENHKQILFKSETIEKSNKERSYELLGDLTIKDTTKKIKLMVELAGINKNSFGREKANFIIKGIINRNDWGLNWNTILEPGRVVVSNEVQINCTLQLKKSTIQDFEQPFEKIMEQKTATQLV